MKKIGVLFLVLLFFMSGCSVDDSVFSQTIVETPLFDVLQKEEGIVYQFKDAYESNMSTGQVPATIDFSSVSEMKKAFVEGSLSDSELSLVHFYARESLAITVLPATLYDFILPENFSVLSVSWENGNYGCSFGRSSEDLFGHVQLFTTKAQYESRYRYSYDVIFQNENVNIVSKEQVVERNATEVCYTTSVASLKSILYEMQFAGHTAYVMEHYLLSGGTGAEDSSSMIPRSVEVFFEGDDNFYRVYLYGLTDRLGVEFLQSFGLKRYVETTDK